MDLLSMLWPDVSPTHLQFKLMSIQVPETHSPYHRRFSMRTVRIDKKDLLLKVTANRANHRRMFEAAQAGFRDAVIMELEKSIADAKKGRRVRTNVELQAPIDQTREYDRIIMQLEMETRNEVELTDEEFSNYVMDQWRWSSQVLGLATMYADEAVLDHNGLSGGREDKTSGSWSPKKFRDNNERL